MATATAYMLRLTTSPPHSHHAPGLPHRRRCLAMKVAPSWVPGVGDDDMDDGLGDWWIPEQPVEQRRAGFGRALPVGLGASAAIALVGLTLHSPPSMKCLHQLIGAPLHYVQEKLSIAMPTEISMVDASVRDTDTVEVPMIAMDEWVEKSTDDKQNHMPTGVACVSFRYPVDHLHEGALSILKKLQIIEKDASSSDFCTRREFARWFVKLCSKLERKRMHRIIPNLLTSGLVNNAFDDVDFDDPDFLYIQSLAECGIVPSNLSSSFGTSTRGSHSDKENSYFLPDSYLSSFDLINWKLLLEHPFASELDLKALGKNVRTIGLSAWPDVSTSILTELISSDKSIVSKVFGNTRCLQPHKPVTKAQAAAALTSGRMDEVICDELNKLEAENQSQLSVIDEMTEELMNRGDIKHYWEHKIKKEQNCQFEVQKHLQHVLQELENERIDREAQFFDLLKERTNLECQNQEIISLRSEVNGMYDRLATESLDVMADDHNLKKLLSSMSSKHQAVAEAKSYLEAEKEAITLLRSWVEEEAARLHERALLLENAVSRWRIPAD